MLAMTIKRIGSCLLQPTPRDKWFETLVYAIVSQQISARAAAAIGLRLHTVIAASGTMQPRDIHASNNNELRAIGLTHAKIASLRDLCLRLDDGRLSFADLSLAPDHQAIRMLDDVRGIGEWTAQMFLIFALGRLDVLPVADIGIQRGIKMVFGFDAMPSAFQVREIARANAWSPYASVASWYLWCIAEPDGNPLW